MKEIMKFVKAALYLLARAQVGLWLARSAVGITGTNKLSKVPEKYKLQIGGQMWLCHILGVPGF